MRMIDANALQDQYIAKMEEVVKSTTTPDISLEALSLLCGYTLIMDAPTIEAEPTKHGSWIYYGQRYGSIKDGAVAMWECSECGHTVWVYLKRLNDWHYCPNCGAKMDGGENGTD